MKPRNQSKQPWKKADHVILKLPFVSDILSARVTQRVRKFSPDVRVVFKSGPSLKQQLVRSQLCPRVCPREVQRSKEKRGCGRPMVCRACDAGMTNGDCILKNVVYSMSCTLCGDLYIGETERPVRVRFQEHYRDAKAKLGTSPWGGHYKIQHRDYSTTVSGFHPFHQAKILGRESSLPSRRYLEATEIRRRRPAVNCDSGWRLSAWVNYAAWYSHLTHICMNSFFSCNLVLMWGKCVNVSWNYASSGCCVNSSLKCNM